MDMEADYPEMGLPHQGDEVNGGFTKLEVALLALVVVLGIGLGTAMMHIA